jgi:hypothetical protein
MTKKAITKNGIVYVRASDIPFFDAAMVRKNNIDFFFEDGETYVDGNAYLYAIQTGLRAAKKEQEEILTFLRVNHPVRYIACMACLPFVHMWWFMRKRMGMKT